MSLTEATEFMVAKQNIIIKEKDDEIEKLKQEIEQLKKIVS